MIDMETLASTLAACHLELVAGILSVFSADTEGKNFFELIRLEWLILIFESGMIGLVGN